MTTENKIKAILADLLGVKVENISNDSTLESIGADSLDLVDITIEIEEQFPVKIEDGREQEFKTVADIIAYVEAHDGSQHTEGQNGEIQPK